MGVRKPLQVLPDTASKLKRNATYINEFFFLVLSRFFQWQGMTAYVPVDDEAAANMAKTMLTPLNQTSSGPSMPEIQVISKKMVAYLESFLAVAPFRKKTDMKIDTKIDKLYESAMKKLGAVNVDSTTQTTAPTWSASFGRGIVAFRPSRSRTTRKRRWLLRMLLWRKPMLMPLQLVTAW